MTYLVYINELRDNGTTHRNTKRRCQTLEEAEQAQKNLIEKTGKFHEIREPFDSFEYLKTSLFRHMPWIRQGMRCNMDGKDGVVTSGDGGSIRIRFNGEKHSVPCHPHWQMTYYNEDGSVLKDYKVETVEA